MNKLRLIFTDKCNKACQGCCNKQYDITKIPKCEDYTPWDEINITGGEPMLMKDHLIAFLDRLRALNPNLVVYVYTAELSDPEALFDVLLWCDGLTITLHTQDDVKDLLAFDEFLHQFESMLSTTTAKSLRLNVFDEVELDKGDLLCDWRVKSNITWIENCPLPEYESLMKYY